MAQDPRTPSPATEDTRSGAGADTSAAPAIDGVLAETLAIVEPLVTWLVRSGVGHAQFAAALKPLFADGRVLATADQHGDQLAVFGIEAALKAMKEKSTPADQQTPVDVVTK